MPGALLQEKNPSTHWRESSVGPRDGLDVLENRWKRFTPAGIQTRDRTDRGLVAVSTRDKK